MLRRSFSAIVAGAALLALAYGIWRGYAHWRANPQVIGDRSLANPANGSAASQKVIVSEQAQENLGLTAKPLPPKSIGKRLRFPA